MACLPPPFFSSVSPGPGREVRNGMGWSLMEKTARSGGMVVPGCLTGKQCIFCICCICWVSRERIVFYSVGGPPSFFVFLFILVCGEARLSGHKLESGAGHCLIDCGGAIAPLMKPWCAEGEVPSAANLNLYRGRSSHVGWHSDDESLFGERGEAKLIVSVSFGTQALFKWKGKSCPCNDGRSCWLGHGDILVMDGQCQDEFRHCTDPGSDQERINITFRWVKQHVASCSFLRDRSGMLFANVCAGIIFF